ncbi:putative SIR2 family protein [Vibrio chagasii]|nr:putative SIR2 family protein [Vibrio chagasii]CAH6894725.1 putative SIR2 family protein [Vibrio chagasii]CAH6937742.1 putative SIR2 family protein [Vibrio chagasii]CAH6963709.1 putative SIR2 family protein [Vibrio chagasii]CAH7018939.1 putative SIR2 family protein [Vibrio chagasii]
MKTKPIKINASLKPYLNEIAEKLWSQPSHATVMVGAGFSKNASNSFPSWVQLGDTFYEKISGEKPTNKDTQYANALKLADSVDAVFGRPALDSLLVNNIPDLTVEPSPLHEELLTFPWSDIFTTNYDTLLERAAGNVVEYRYDVVVNSQELINSTQPRIIKLHGSFPTAKPFIITEEDYRTYPSKFAPFVNTVQQSLLENTLCLIGFSGDDPNFLKWIGWIRDNLGENNSLRIYLIGVFNFSDADKALLSKRNIIAVDMFSCEGIGEHDHYKALELFFKYLRDQKEQEVDLEWPAGIRLPLLDHEMEKLPQVEAICDTLEKYRESYPGWIIAPKKSRDEISNKVIQWCSKVTLDDKLNDKLLKRFVDVLVWYSNISLSPIFDDFAELIISVLEKYESDVYLLEAECSLARYYREEYRWSDYEKLMSRLAIKHGINNRVIYESCLGNIAKLQFDTLKKQLNSWTVPIEQPEWSLKKSALLAEAGDTDDAYVLAKDALKYIRSQLNLSRLNENIRLLSLESFAMVHLRMMPRKGGDNNANIGPSSKRWSVLSSYKCDPYGEMDAFKSSLKSSELPLATSTNYEFSIGARTTNRQYNHTASVVKAYSYLRFYEEAGVPVRCGNYVMMDSEVTENSISLLSNLFPLMSLVFSVRFQSSKSIKKLLSRKNIFNISTTDATYASEIFMDFWERNLEDKSLNKETIDRVSSSIVEVLAYLSPILHSDVNIKTYSFVLKLLCSGKVKYDNKVDLFFKLQSESVPVSRAFEFSNVAFSSKIKSFNMFFDVHIAWHIDFSNNKKGKLPDGCLDYLLSLLVDGNEISYKYSLSGLFIVLEHYELDDIQLALISANVFKLYNSEVDWKKVGFLYTLPFLTVGDDKSRILADFKAQVNKLDIPICGSSTGYTGYGESIDFFHFLNSYKQNVNLTNDEKLAITNKLLEWWDTDKNRIDDKRVGLFGSSENEFRARFRNLLNSLKAIVLPNQDGIRYEKSVRESIERLVCELEASEFPVLTQKYQLHGFNVDIDDDFENSNFKGLNNELSLMLSDDIYISISSSNEVITRDAIDTLEFWLKGELSGKPNEIQIKNILQLSNKLLFLGGECLPRALYCMHSIILNYKMFLPKEVWFNYIITNSKIYSTVRIFPTDNQEAIGKTLILRQIASQCAKNLVDELELEKVEKDELSCWGKVKSDYFDFNDVNSYWL